MSEKIKLLFNFLCLFPKLDVIDKFFPDGFVEMMQFGLPT